MSLKEKANGENAAAGSRGCCELPSLPPEGLGQNPGGGSGANDPKNFEI